MPPLSLDKPFAYYIAFWNRGAEGKLNGKLNMLEALDLYFILMVLHSYTSLQKPSSL
jgi:hypothetical protein